MNEKGTIHANELFDQSLSMNNMILVKGRERKGEGERARE